MQTILGFGAIKNMPQLQHILPKQIKAGRSINIMERGLVCTGEHRQVMHHTLHLINKADSRPNQDWRCSPDGSG